MCVQIEDCFSDLCVMHHISVLRQGTRQDISPGKEHIVRSLGAKKISMGISDLLLNRKWKGIIDLPGKFCMGCCGWHALLLSK